MSFTAHIKKIVICVVALALLAGAGWYGRPVYRDWKQRRLLKQAREFVAQADLRNATLCARKVLAMNPTNLEATRLMAKVTVALRSPVAVDWWRRIAELEPDVAQNHLEFATAALAYNQTATAAKALSVVPEAQRHTAGYHMTAAIVAAAVKQLSLAERHFTAALALEPTNQMAQLNLAVLQIQATDTNAVNTGRARLEALCDSPQHGRDALRHLVRDATRRGEFSRAATLAQKLQSLPSAAFEDRLLYLSALKANHDDAWRQQFDLMQEAGGQKPEPLLQLAAWLREHEGPDASLKWLQALPLTVRSNQPLSMATVDAYTAKKDWQSIKDYLSDQNWAGADFLRRATLARAHLEAGEALASQVNWKAALKAASDRPKALAALLTLLESWNWQNEREELLWVLVQRFPGERWAFQSLNDFYLASNNTRGLHKLYSSVIGYDVADAAAKNNFAATALLLNTQTNRAHELAREVYKVNPQNGIFASTYAYSLYLQGKVDEALRVFERLNPESLTAPSIAVYYGAVLAATDQRPKALKYLDLAEQGKLLPEEQALVAAVRAP